jgi:RND superfamily putative drug exporter
MGILIDTFIVRTITVPALAAMIGQKNWWPSSLGKSPAQVHRAQQIKQLQLDHLAGRLVRMKVIPSHKSGPLPRLSGPPDAPPANAGERPVTFEDVLVRLKLVPPRKKRAPVGPAGSDSRPTGNGKPSVGPLPTHSLPLFDLSGVRHRLTDDVSESAMDSSNAAATGNGKPKSDGDLGHSLPLFGNDILSSRPVLVGANGNGHSNGNGHGEHSIEDDLSNPLPLFGTSYQATNGNGNGKH